MTVQLHHLIAQQEIADSHEAAAKDRLMSGDRRHSKPIAALLARCRLVLAVGAPARRSA